MHIVGSCWTIIDNKLTSYQHTLRKIPQERVSQGYMIPDVSG